MKIQKEATRIITPPLRVYTPEELKDFESRIQRFMVPKTLKSGETVETLNWDELAVAYGAFVKREGKKGNFYYLVAKHDTKPSRYEQFINIMDQLSFWKSGKDWKQEMAARHQAESYEQMAMELDVQDKEF